MSRVDAAAPDRLPWLSDEPETRPAKRRRPNVAAWGAAAIVMIAGCAFWLGEYVVRQPGVLAPQPTTETTVRLPEPRTVTPEVRLPDAPQVNTPAPVAVRPAPTREVRISVPPAAHAPRTEDKSAAVEREAAAAAPPTTVAPTRAAMPKPWNPRVFAGAAGRVVQIGAFGSIRQAKLGWWHMVRAYPAMSRLPAVVRPTRNSKGRIFYRFQVGTTSQAHSEVLCQRMERITFSCAVVGLPWKVKVER
jgi:hypothetical protein